MNAPKNNLKENKSQDSLIPLDLIVPMLEPAMREGVEKYQRESFRLGFKASVMYDSLMHHLKSWFFELESYDPETKEKYDIDKHHLGAAMFCLINLYNTDIRFSELDDRPPKILEKYIENKAQILCKTNGDIAAEVINKAFNKQNINFFNKQDINSFNFKDLIDKTVMIKSVKEDNNEVIIAKDIKTKEAYVLQEINHATDGSDLL